VAAVTDATRTPSVTANTRVWVRVRCGSFRPVSDGAAVAMYTSLDRRRSAHPTSLVAGPSRRVAFAFGWSKSGNNAAPVVATANTRTDAVLVAPTSGAATSPPHQPVKACVRPITPTHPRTRRRPRRRRDTRQRHATRQRAD